MSQVSWSRGSLKRTRALRVNAPGNLPTAIRQAKSQRAAHLPPPPPKKKKKWLT